MRHLTILDFTTGDVDIYPIDEYGPDMEEPLKKLGHSANNCQWMFGTGSIAFHKEVLKCSQ